MPYGALHCHHLLSSYVLIVRGIAAPTLLLLFVLRTTI